MSSKGSIQTKLSTKPVDGGHALPSSSQSGRISSECGVSPLGWVEMTRAGNAVSRVDPKAFSGPVHRHVTEVVPRCIVEGKADDGLATVMVLMQEMTKPER